MKIKDILNFEKKHSEIRVMKYGTPHFTENETQLKFEKKHGYYWKIPSHSREKSVLLNNYERDCVIAYIENNYMTIFLIKIRGKDNYKPFIYLRKMLKSVIGSYTINLIHDDGDLIEVFDIDKKNLKIIEDKEYQRFMKLMILRNLN